MFAQVNEKAASIHRTLGHIQQQKNVLAMQIQQAMLFCKKAEDHIQNLLKDDYLPAREKCFALLSIILKSPEYIETIEQVTDIELTQIVEHNMNFDDIVIDPTKFPLQQKLQTELSLAAFDAQTEQLFNVFYVFFAISQGSQALLQKLVSVEAQLSAELQVQTIIT